MTFFWWLIPVAIVALGLWLWTPDKTLSELEARYLDAPSDMLDVNGITLHVRDSGLRSAPAVILIHGTGSHLQTWDGWVKPLETEFRVVRFDLPGAGLSPPAPDADYSDETTIDIVLALMSRLEIDKAVVIGNSLGGRIAWRFAASHPERVSGLVLVSPDGYASPGFEYGQAPKVPFIMNAMKYALPRSMLKSNLAVAYSDPSRLSNETFERYYELMLAPGGREALLERMRQTVLVKPEPVLQRIEAPVLLLWGVDDKMIPVSNSADYMASLPNATLVTLQGLGHVPHEEDAETSVQPVLQFLRGL